MYFHISVWAYYISWFGYAPCGHVIHPYRSIIIYLPRCMSYIHLGILYILVWTPPCGHIIHPYRYTLYVSIWIYYISIWMYHCLSTWVKHNSTWIYLSYIYIDALYIHKGGTQKWIYNIPRWGYDDTSR